MSELGVCPKCGVSSTVIVTTWHDADGEADVSICHGITCFWCKSPRPDLAYCNGRVVRKDDETE